MSQRKPRPDSEYDLTLRLWSKDTPLGPVASALRLPTKHLYVKGCKMGGNNKWAKDRIADCHYISTEAERVRTEQEVEAWLASTVSRAEQTPSLRQPGIEIVFWIALFAREPKAALMPDPVLVAHVAALRARILVENYSDPSNQPPGAGFPPKVWYPALVHKVGSPHADESTPLAAPNQRE